MIQSITNGNITKTSGYSSNLKKEKATQVPFSSLRFKKELIETSNLGLGRKMGRFIEETKESLGRIWGKLTGDNAIPVTKRPLTANGEIIHMDSSGNPIKIEVPDKDIKPGVDGQNIYRHTGDGTAPEETPKYANIWEQSEVEAEAKVQQESGHANIWERSEAEAASRDDAQRGLSHEIPDDAPVAHTSSQSNEVPSVVQEEHRHKGFFEELFGGDDGHIGSSPADDIDIS